MTTTPTGKGGNDMRWRMILLLVLLGFGLTGSAQGELLYGIVPTIEYTCGSLFTAGGGLEPPEFADPTECRTVGSVVSAAASPSDPGRVTMTVILTDQHKVGSVWYDTTPPITVTFTGRVPVTEIAEAWNRSCRADYDGDGAYLGSDRLAHPSFGSACDIPFVSGYSSANLDYTCSADGPYMATHLIGTFQEFRLATECSVHGEIFDIWPLDIDTGQFGLHMSLAFGYQQAPKLDYGDRAEYPTNPLGVSECNRVPTCGDAGGPRCCFDPLPVEQWVTTAPGFVQVTAYFRLPTPEALDPLPKACRVDYDGDGAYLGMDWLGHPPFGSGCDVIGGE